MKRIAVSVIMPSLNVRDYIEESIKSVQNQTLQNIEIICIDAGSNDGTLEIINKLAEKDKRIIVIHSDKKSYGYQVNFGIKVAKGDYIAVVETDDYIDCNMYQKLYLTALQYDVDIIKSDYYAYWIQENGEKWLVSRKLFSDDFLYHKIIKPKNYMEIALADWYLWTGIYKKTFLEENQIHFSETLGAAFQDIGFLHRTNAVAERVYYLKDSFYHYCLDRENSSSNSGKGFIYSYQEFLSLLEDKKIYEEQKCEISLYCRMAKSFFCCCLESAIRDIKEIPTDIYLYFQNQLCYAIKNNLLNEDIIPSGMWKKLLMMLESYDIFYQNIKDNNTLIKETLGNSDTEKIIIFGCGKYGYDAYKWLKKEGYYILAFTDNNPGFWNKKINGLNILSPKDSLRFSKSCKYLIANEKYSFDIKEQLLKLGVDKSKICIFS